MPCWRAPARPTSALLGPRMASAVSRRLTAAPRSRSSGLAGAPPAGERTRTTGVARPRDWPMGPCASSLPLLMMSTSSTVCSTSASTWLETSTVVPSAARSRRKVRSQRMPSGSRPLAGSSSSSTSRVAEQRAGQGQALPHAGGVALHGALRRVAELDQLEARRRRARSGMPAAARQRRAGRCGRSGRGGSRTRRAARRPASPGARSVAVAAAEDAHGARTWGARGRRSSAGWWSCRRRWGRGSR